MAECTKPAIPGSGVCPGQSTGRGILDDAVALVRGDRFLSYDFNSNTLTQWGAAQLSERAAGAYGGILPVLILKGLPGEFNGTSPYALLPFYTPEAVKGILKGNKVLDKYSIERPAGNNAIISVQSQAAVTQVLSDPATFKIAYPAGLGSLKGGKDFITGSETSLHKTLAEPGFEKNVSVFFSTKVKELIAKNTMSFRKGRNTLDIVRDVTNVAPILWVADRFAIPLKTEEESRGLLTPFETFGAYLAVFLYQNFNMYPAKEWKLRASAFAGAEALGQVFETHLKTQSGLTEKVVDWLAKGSQFQVGPNADRLYHALIDSKQSMADSVSDCLSVGAPVVGLLTKQAALIIDLYLSPGHEQSKERLIQLANAESASSEKELQAFVFEGIRLSGAVPGLGRVATKEVTIEDGARGPITIKAGQTVLAATSKAGLDPTAFPDPEKVNTSRPISDYAALGYGLGSPFGASLVGASLAATLREVFKLKNLRKAPGKLGNFTTVNYEIGGVDVDFYLDDNSKESPVPTSLTLHYDA